MRKSELTEKIKRRLGHPMVKVELDEATICDNIDYARQKFIKWAVGQATQEKYFTLMLSGGVSEYEMPANIVEVVSYDINTYGGVNQLFTISNYLYSQGMMDQMLLRGAGSGYTMLSYHIAKDFLETIKRYAVTAYTFRYHKYTNTLEVNPTPPSGGRLVVNGVEYDSPGFVLIKAFEIEGTDEDLYENMWIFDYATALSKMVLGRIRSKFANFQAIGNMNVQMDGDTLISEAREELEKLDEQLKNEEAFEGYGIIQA